MRITKCLSHPHIVRLHVAASRVDCSISSEVPKGICADISGLDGFRCKKLGRALQDDRLP